MNPQAAQNILRTHSLERKLAAMPRPSSIRLLLDNGALLLLRASDRAKPQAPMIWRCGSDRYRPVSLDEFGAEIDWMGRREVMAAMLHPDDLARLLTGCTAAGGAPATVQ